MSGSREHRNASMLEDACAAIGMTITTFSHLHGALAHALPDDFPAIEGELRLLASTHEALRRRVVDGEPERGSAEADAREVRELVSTLGSRSHRFPRVRRSCRRAC